MAEQRLTDKLGNTTGYIKQDSGGKLRLTDKLGNTLGYFDTRDNRLSDKLGNTTGYARRESGGKLRLTDRLGNTLGYFDPKDGRTTDKLGNTTGYTKRESGGKRRFTDKLGNTTGYSQTTGNVSAVNRNRTVPSPQRWLDSLFHNSLSKQRTDQQRALAATDSATHHQESGGAFAPVGSDARTVPQVTPSLPKGCAGPILLVVAAVILIGVFTDSETDEQEPASPPHVAKPVQPPPSSSETRTPVTEPVPAPVQPVTRPQPAQPEITQRSIPDSVSPPRIPAAPLPRPQATTEPQIASLPHKPVIPERQSVALTHEVSRLCRELLARPDDVALLDRLKTEVTNSRDTDEKPRLATIYYLGLLNASRGTEAEAVRQYLVKTFPEHSALENLRRSVLSEPCTSCDGSGFCQVPCKNCVGSGRCTYCDGYGTKAVPSFEGRTRGVKCSRCKGTGTCPICNGKNALRTRCDACDGSGRNISKERIRATYVRMLEEELPNRVPGE